MRGFVRVDHRDVVARMKAYEFTTGWNCIYALCDPRDYTARYIGKTARPDVRLAQHIWETHQNPLLRAWLADLDTAGHIPEMIILQQSSDQSWEHHERAWIHLFRTLGTVYNVEDGGKDPVKPAPLQPGYVARKSIVTTKDRRRLVRRGRAAYWKSMPAPTVFVRKRRGG